MLRTLSLTIGLAIALPLLVAPSHAASCHWLRDTADIADLEFLREAALPLKAQLKTTCASARRPTGENLQACACRAAQPELTRLKKAYQKIILDTHPSWQGSKQCYTEQTGSNTSRSINLNLAWHGVYFALSCD